MVSWIVSWMNLKLITEYTFYVIELLPMALLQSLIIFSKTIGLKYSYGHNINLYFISFINLPWLIKCNNWTHFVHFLTPCLHIWDKSLLQALLKSFCHLICVDNLICVENIQVFNSLFLISWYHIFIMQYRSNKSYSQMIF